jgi:hypothetical protein
VRELMVPPCRGRICHAGIVLRARRHRTSTNGLTDSCSRIADHKMVRHAVRDAAATTNTSPSSATTSSSPPRPDAPRRLTVYHGGSREH